MGIPLFPGLIYATDCSQEKGNMRASTGTKAKQEASSNRAEHAFACITLRDVIKYAGSQRALILLTDSKCLLMAIQKWIGEGLNLTIKESPDGDIIQKTFKLLRVRIHVGLSTLFVKIISHRDEFFNEMAHRWADKGRHTETEAT